MKIIENWVQDPPLGQQTKKKHLWKVRDPLSFF